MESVLLFGGSGCLGRALIKDLLGKYNIINFSRDEHKQWAMDQDLGKGKVTHVIGDAIDTTLVKTTLVKYNPSRIYILHALKHVDRCQENIHACITTNLLSVKNVLDCIHELHYVLTNLQAVCFTSTDKAPSPVNTYGMCKALCEEMIVDKARSIPRIKFVTVRYGNVINSTCSLLPALLRNTTDKVYKITHEKMTRFLMTIRHACETIEYAFTNGQSGEVIIPKVKSFYVRDLINLVARLRGKDVMIIGLRPGERLYETLINDTQSMRTYKQSDYYHIRPYYNIQSATDPFVYDSNTDVITDPMELHSLIEPLICENQADHA